MKKTLFLLTLLLLAGAVLPLTAAQALSYVDLASRLTDLEYLARVPAPGEQCAQWSSYDRKSRYDAATGKYVNWDANGDGSGIIRKEGGQQVFAEMEGPGCIYRIWSAAPKEGHVRIYLDGATEPVVDLPFIGYFDGKNAPFTRPALVHTVARGWNNYTPIPYRKSCKIVADANWGAYFQFNYVTFPKDTEVPTFKRELSAEENAALDKANRLLTECNSPANGETLKFTSGKVSGRAETVRLSGPAAIASLQVKVDGLKPGDLETLRAITLEIRWDGESQPSVWAPLGDFFGSAPGANPYKSYPLGLREDGWFYCNWFMPFAKSAEITFRNEGPAAASLQYKVGTRKLSDTAGFGRFHCKWHLDALLPAEPERRIDWPLVKTTGAGRFVGVMLHVWNPRGGWWGEGDEKFFVDGEKFPSTFGTGSEDYFGYAWCDPHLFQNAYHNQTRNDGNNKGHVSVNRWQIGDSVPFHKSFEGCIEKYYANERPTLYASTAYWYLDPAGNDPYPPAALSARIGYWTNVASASKVKGAIEGESLKVLSKTGGDPQEQDLTAWTGAWSNDAHLWWINARPGDKLDLALPVAKTGVYDIAMQFTKAPDYGITQLYLDGEKLGAPLDLYNPAVVPSGLVNFGSRNLTAGTHKLTAEIVGANPKAVKRYMFGLDYVKLDAAR